MDTQLEVDLGVGGQNVYVGTAHFTRRGRAVTTTFTYSPTYLARPGAYAVDPALPLDVGRGHTTGLPGAFADSAPDRWGRRLIEKAWPGPASISEVDYLVGVSDHSRQGALRYRRPDNPDYVADGHDIPRLVDLGRLLHASDQLAAAGRNHDADELHAVRELLDVGGTTLGGARPKASVIDADGALSIAKFPHPGDEWDVMAWEKTALDLAERAGLDVPTRHLTKVDGRSVLILRRFDRDGEDRLGYASAMTLTGLTDGDPADYLDLAAAIADHSPQPDADLADLWRRMALFTAIHNIDDHFRNHGFLHSPGGWKLAPAFDVNPNPDPNKARATSINGATSTAEEREALLEAAPYFGVAPDRGLEILTEVEVAAASWRAVAAGNGIPDHELRAFADVFPAPSGSGSVASSPRFATLQAGAFDAVSTTPREDRGGPGSLPRPPVSPTLQFR
jgi:serine/threonine-protein kinase HipA